MRNKYSILYILFIVVSTNAFSCEEEEFMGIRHIESIYTDKRVEAVLGKAIAGSSCDIYNLGLDYLDVDKMIAGPLFCNSAWKGSLDGAYNCAIFLINESDRELGLVLINSLNTMGYKKAGYYLFKKTLSYEEISEQDLSKLKEYSKDIAQAKYLYDLYLCKISGVNHVGDCFQ